MPRSRILKDIPPLRFGEGRDCTLPACLSIATGIDYDWIMGVSAAAFATTIDAASWDPLAAAPLDDATLSQGAHAAGMRPDVVGPPFDEEMRSLVLDRVIEAIEAKVPALVRGIAGPPEYGLVVGYDDEGPLFFARTYFDKTDRPTKIDWSAFSDATHGQLAFLDRGAAPDRAKLAHEGVREALRIAESSERALTQWLDGVRDDARWADTRHAGAAAFADHAMRTLHVDKRRAAARFLRGARALFPNAPGADVLRAAESYGYSAEAAEKIGSGPFDASVAMRFLDPGHRRAWAKQLETIIAHEREAHSALATAEGTMR
jgi:hypothetical protein